MVLVGVAERFVGGQGQVASAGVAVFGLFGHAAGDHRVKGFGDARADGAGLGMGPIRWELTSVPALSARYGGAPVKHSCSTQASA